MRNHFARAFVGRVGFALAFLQLVSDKRECIATIQIVRNIISQHSAHFTGLRKLQF
jgi:hypothetical protein